LASKVFQSVITQLHEATDRSLGVIDSEGVIIAASDTSYIGLPWTEALTTISASKNKLAVWEGKTFRVFSTHGPKMEYAVFISGTDSVAESFSQMAAIALKIVKANCDEKYDRATFIKNVITDNVLPGDVYLRAKELGFSIDAMRAVFLIRQKGRSDGGIFDAVQAAFADNEGDYVLNINETDVVFIKLVDENATEEAMCEYAAKIEKEIARVCGRSVMIGIGSVSNYLREIATSYKEAQVAIQVGKIFYSDKKIIHYQNLGIGRLIYQLPTTLCEMFLAEVFKKNNIDSLDQETLFTIQRFFENNLNVSETSRKLFVHRNTLVYRLEKIKKLTGLDLREFDGAIVFKVALMVKKYLDSRESKPMKT
jgi:carbohydrate diacid regulator